MRRPYVNLNARMQAVDDKGTTDTADDTTEDAGGVYISIEKVIGGDEPDVLIGNARTPTTLIGGGGNDMLVGGAGGDRLEGGAGGDSLRGGGGSDTFVYTGGTDTIEDFQISVRGGATDKIDLTALDLSPTELGVILRGADNTTTTGTTVLTFEGTNNTLTLTGISNEGAEALEVGDFIL